MSEPPTGSDTGSDPLRQRLAVIADRARQTNQRRVDELAGAVAGWSDLDDEGRAAAIGVAHALAGSAGTFGYDGVSDTARELEACLAGGSVTDTAPGLVGRLRDGLAAEPEL